MRDSTVISDICIDQHLYASCWIEILFVSKASENKNAIVVFAFQTPPNFIHFGLTFAVKFFSSVYHPQDVPDEKVSSALAYWEHGKRNGIAMESRRNRRNRDRFPTDFRQSFVRETFRRDSVGIPS